MQKARVENKLIPWRFADHIQTHSGQVNVSTLIGAATAASQKASFALGVTMIRNRVETLMSGREEKEELARERFCVIMRGAVRVKIGEIEHRLNTFDCLYAPIGTTYLIGEADGQEAIFFWVFAPPFSDPKSKVSPTEEKNARIVRLQDVSPSVFFDVPPDRRTSYEMIRGANFSVGLVRRPSGAYGPLHIHDPPDSEEAYVAIQGTLQITGLTGVADVLQPFDGLYVPPFGGNSNRNIGHDECVYAYVEYPAVGIKEIPVN